jgi:hypothetical protein
MAGRNNLYLFAWLCAVVLPLALQWISSALPEVKDYLGYYYGWFSLYMFFALTYSFGTVFVSFYQISGYHKAGTLDLLRVSGISPRDVLLGAFLQLELILAPPLAGFALVLLAYGAWTAFIGTGDEPAFAGLSWDMIIGGALMMLVNQALLGALQCLGLYRREAPLALASALLVLPFNALPVLAIMVLHLPVLIFVLLMLIVLTLVLWAAERNLARLWPPQATVRRGV